MERGMSLTPLFWFALLLVPLALGAGLYAWRPAWRARIAPVIGTALLYGLAGPPLGGLLVAIPGLVTADDPQPGLMLAFIIAMSWITAGVPALAGGACVALLRPRLGAVGRLLAAAACCAATSALFALLIELRGEGVAMMAGLGAVSGLLLEAACLGWRRWRPRGAQTASA